MARNFTKIPDKTFEQLQLNAGVVLPSFDPKSPTIKESDIMFATTDGLEFSAEPSYSDFGEDIDNCPVNMMELKNLDSLEIKLSGTALTVTPQVAKTLAGAADIDAQDATKVVPRGELTTADFIDVWWVGDYGTKGFIAIHLKNALNTAGLDLQSTDKGKGQFSFEFTAHYSMAAQEEVPYELYVSTASDADAAA